ncbi:MAG TPA: ABC transporter ATP-binding protein [Pirellulales bacterium]|nr:ABC transporter ATP-binding protein [Pirellulales bacterium]
MSLLQTEELAAGYGDFQALFGVSLAIEQGETVAIIGANGAGKSTLLRTICGLLRSRRPADVCFEKIPIGGLDPERIIGLGIAMVPEGRRAFPSLSVDDNLRMGAYCGRKGPWTLDRVYALFPNLAERRFAGAPTLSGGQQQMLAIGRALMANPKLLLCDELSLGLAPIVIRDIYAAMPGIRAEGTTILIVEQDIQRALRAADRVYCIQKGRVTLQGRPGQLSRDEIKSAYFGI